MRKLTTNIFIEKAIMLHGNFFDYSLVDYVNNKTKVKIICPKHGIFEQIPSSHLCGRGCLKCGEKNKLNINDLIAKANKIHDNKYDYSRVNYINNNTNIEIVCPKHGKFKQTPDSHLHGRGCPKCANKNVTTNEFIIKADLIHDNKYDYSMTHYLNNASKVKIICPKHGIFEQTPNSHLSGQGCPTCKSSKGELLIKRYLDEHNVEYVKEKYFIDCKGEKRTLLFDFYLPKQNILLEYDGIQHFMPIKFFGGEKTFNSLKRRDTIKNNFAKNNNIDLLRIKYSEINDINKILKEIL